MSPHVLHALFIGYYKILLKYVDGWRAFSPPSPQPDSHATTKISAIDI